MKQFIKAYNSNGSAYGAVNINSIRIFNAECDKRRFYVDVQKGETTQRMYFKPEDVQSLLLNEPVKEPIWLDRFVSPKKTTVNKNQEISVEVLYPLVALANAVRAVAKIELPNDNPDADYLSREFLGSMEEMLCQQLVCLCNRQSVREEFLSCMKLSYLIEDCRNMASAYGDTNNQK